MAVLRLIRVLRRLFPRPSRFKKLNPETFSLEEDFALFFFPFPPSPTVSVLAWSLSWGIRYYLLGIPQ
jgi:hypothetical protein